MKYLFVTFFLFVFAASLYAVNIKPITQVNDINKVGEEYYSKPVSWFQGDSIKFDVYARNVRSPIDFTGQAFPVLFVTAETNRQLVYVAQTGTVVNATNGHVSVTVPASGATLDTNQNYAAWMIVFRESGGVTAEVATVAYSQAQVLPSPLGVTYTNVEPITNFYIDVDGILAEYDPVFTASVAYTITSGMTSQWTQAYNWGDASTQNLGKGWSRYPATQNVNFAEYYATNIGGADFDLTPSGSVAPGKLQWNPDFETLRLGLDANVSMDLGQQSMAYVRNAESVTISNGMVVYISGATGDKASVKIASYSNDTLSARTIGIAAENITAGSLGFVVTRGPVYKQNTSAFTAGSMLYLGAYGNVSTNRPQAPLHGVFIGVVEKVNANAGIIYVAVQNGFEFDELHDVNVSGVSSGQILQYNGTVWTNANAAYLPLAGGTMTGPITNAVSTSEFITSLFMQNANGGIRQTIQAGSSTNNPRAEFVASLVGVGDAHFGLDPDSIYIGRQDTSYPTTNALVRIDRVTGVAYFKQQPVIPGYLTTALAASTYATGAPLYEVDLSPYATGTPIYSIAGLATGTPLYAYTETDPVWVAERSNYATGTPIYSVAGLATGTPLYEVDLSPYATGTPIYSVAGLATGTPLYAFTETDPVWTSAASNYLTSTGAAATYLPLTGGTMSGLIDMQDNTITNASFIYGSQGHVEFENAIFSGPNPWAFSQQPTIPGYLTSTGAAATYLPIAGGAMNGHLDLDANNIDNVSALNFSTGASFEEGSVSNLTFSGKMNGLVLSDGLSFSSQQSKIAHTEGGSPYIEINDDVIYYGGIHELTTNATVRIYGKSDIKDIDELVVSNATLGQIILSDSSSKGVIVGSYSNISTMYFRPGDTNEMIGIRGGKFVVRKSDESVAFIIAPDGIYDEDGNLLFSPDGNISQKTIGTTRLGTVTAQTVTATTFFGAFNGNGASITNLNLSTYNLATGTPLYVEADPIWTSASSLYYTAAQVDSAFATGTPIYSLAGYATGTPLYAYTETDPIWTAASSSYYTASQADALFATGSPVYSLAGYATGTPLYAYTESDPVYAANSNRLNLLEAYTNRAASALSSSVWASADSTTNYQSRSEFVASSNDINIRLVAVEQYTNRADAALDSNTWASADSTTNYASRVDYNAFVASFVSSVSNWAVYPANATVDMGQQSFTNAATISRVTNSINFNSGTLGGTWTFSSQPSIPGYLTTNGNASGLSAFPSSLLTVSAGNTNYLRHTTANPTNATYPGQWNQFTYTYRDATSIIMKVYGPSNKWYGIVLNELPIE